MSIRIGNDLEPDPPKSAAEHIASGIGCLLSAIGIAVVLWALSDFPGLPR